ncbi:hypothetical protein Tcan_10090 [Toxocara canis]|uniref:Uncharacterized protein n=1 Tax=Toxocara canis TaxID=6265 RepID=A0A0B2VP82_TOXCA|nr:hypothetical protein Tcan_10090 [Toxocara canis]
MVGGPEGPFAARRHTVWYVPAKSLGIARVGLLKCEYSSWSGSSSVSIAPGRASQVCLLPRLDFSSVSVAPDRTHQFLPRQGGCGRYVELGSGRCLECGNNTVRTLIGPSKYFTFETTKD